MKKLILLAGVLLLATQSQAAEYLVKYKNENGLRSLFSMASMNKTMQVTDRHDVGQLIKVDIEDSKKAAVIAQLLKNNNIEYVVPNFKLKAFTAPMDTQALQNQWAIVKVNAEKAWAKLGNKGSRKVTVAVIDTGVDYNHKDLKVNMTPGFNFKDNNNDPMDKTGAQNPGHGTHCAGIIGASGLVDGGIIGLSPEVTMMPLRFLGEDGSGDLNAGIKAIDYAISKKVDVISASWGATVNRATAQPLIEAVKRADDAGIIFVVAAANDGRNNDVTDVFPANAGFPNTISVAASGDKDEKPQWSNYGTKTVHVAAPGLNIMSTLPKDKYGNLSGTSMATPLVSGLVALLKSYKPDLTGREARALLQSTGVDVQIQTACNCRVDAFNSVDALMSQTMIAVPNAGTYAINDQEQFTTLHGKAPFKFESTNPAVATIDERGTMTAVSKGETQIKITDTTGAVATTRTIHVGEVKDDGGGGSCPLGDPALCQIMCQIMPQMPWCQ